MKYLHILVGLILYAGLVRSQQTFLETPQSVTSPPGRDVTLTCRVNNRGGQCRWQKDGKPVGLYPGKYSVAGQAEGDCSLTVHDVDIKLDDGEWQCQVTATSYNSQDALASSGARLTVEVAPESVSLQYKGATVEGDSLSVTENQLEEVECVTRHSNPAPLISWYLGNTLLASGLQTNTTEGAGERWRSESRLSHKFSVGDRGSLLRCVVTHSGYSLSKGQHEVSKELDILYKPLVTISRRDSTDQLEEGVSSVLLTCNVNSNPSSSVSWTRLDRDGNRMKIHEGRELRLSPVRRESGGTYICTATNTVGQSEPGQTVVEVMFPPSRVEVRPVGRQVLGLHNSTRLECAADGQPAPRYQWLQTTVGGERKVRSYSSHLDIASVSYTDQGSFTCLAITNIAGRRKELSSQEVELTVQGPPQVLRQSGQVVGLDGSDVRLEAEFCSDPSPSRSVWRWAGAGGQLVLASGEQEGSGRFRADLVSSASHNCYVSRLTVRGAEQGDSRLYTLTVDNMHGTDTAPVTLTVRAPMPVTSAITAASLLAVSLILMVCACLLCRSKRKLCFRASAEKDVNNAHAQNSYSNKAESKVSLVNETKDKNGSQLKITPH